MMVMLMLKQHVGVKVNVDDDRSDGCLPDGNITTLHL